MTKFLGIEFLSYRVENGYHATCEMLPTIICYYPLAHNSIYVRPIK